MGVSVARLRVPDRLLPGRLLLLMLAAAAALAISGCGGGGAATSGGGGAASGGSAAPITVTTKELDFEPKELTAPVGKTVTVTVKNTSTAIHNMQVMSNESEGKVIFASKVIVNPGMEDKFDVKFTKAGTYKFTCIYHLPNMVGTITAK